MLAPLFKLKGTRGKGQGLFAKRFIPAGTIVFFECPKCRVIPRSKFQKLSARQRERLLFHAYTRRDGSVVMPCGLSPYMNHSCDANVLDSGRGFDIVVRDIKKGREATYDYRVFYDEDWGFECRCGAENCCGTFRCRHPLPRGLRRDWETKLKPALAQARKVPQPLGKALAANLPKTRRLLG
jgi:SET domain-containing protein